ncbi:hypothetical protein [Pseudomonas sp. nanlin1]|uniref:hypothetical protein n=1 Tax=Pseudomonas sp. nanlin1 TaxID=3040605 RepID=UPI00388F843D
MIDYKEKHCSLLATIASGEAYLTVGTHQTLTALALAGFVTIDRVRRADGLRVQRVTLTAAGHEYLAGLWY